MPFGKGQAFETDIRLPMYIAGPGIPSGAKMTLPTTHLDITATLVAWAGASAHAPMAELDGKSFAAEIKRMAALPKTQWDHRQQHQDAMAWRNYSFSEFFTNNNTWQHLRFLRAHPNGTAAPGYTFTRWCTGDTEVYDLAEDPHQMHNLVGAAGAQGAFAEEVAAVGLPMVQALGACRGPAACNAKPTVPPAIKQRGSTPLPCYQSRTGKSRFQGSWDFQGKDKTSGRPWAAHGWAFDFKVDGWPSQKARGTDPISVRLTCGGEPVATRIANVTRPDLAGKGYPSVDHGFVFEPLSELLPADAWTAAKVEIDVRGLPGLHSLKSNGPTARCLCHGAPCEC